MKILFSIPRLTYSGAPKMMAWVANQMAERGHSVHLVTFFSEEQARFLHKDVTMTSLRIEQSKSRLVRNTTGMLNAISRLHKTVKEQKPDIVVSFLDSVGYVYLPICRFLTKAKIVVSERADPHTYRGLQARIRFLLMKFAHGTVFQTPGAQRFFEKDKRIYHGSMVIPNPVVLSEYVLKIQQNIPRFHDRDKQIVTVGRLSLHQKRQDILLDAFKLFHDKHPEYCLKIYGDGPDGGKIQKMIEERGLSDCAFLEGVISRVEERIFNAAAFVLTSDYEGIPNALIEAMSVGVPSVSTDCSPGGAALLIRNGENGFLVQRRDVEAIADKLSVIVSDATTTERISQNSPSVTREFAEEVIAAKWEMYFKEITGEKGQ